MSGERVLNGRYRLQGLLGAGGMAEVHRATDEVLGRQVAVKVLSPTEPSDEFAARLQSEFRTLAKVSHPGLVALHDAGQDGDEPFYVMELVEGETLADRLRRGPLDSHTVVELGRGLAEALAAVHDAGIVHRDVKPANVMIARDGTAKLTDFGIARIVEQAHGDETHAAAPPTQTGAVIGTPNYLAPEQVAGRDVTAAADVYSLGLLLLEAATGERTYPGTGVPAAVARLERDPEVPDHLPPGLAEELRAMTARNPLQRPSAREVAEALRDPGRARTGRTQPTAVLPTGGGPRTAVLPPSGGDDRTRREHAPPPRQRPPQRQPQRSTSDALPGGMGMGAAALALALLVGTVIAIALAVNSGVFESQPDVPLEQDLQRLEQSVGL